MSYPGPSNFSGPGDAQHVPQHGHVLVQPDGGAPGQQRPHHLEHFRGLSRRGECRQREAMTRGPDPGGLDRAEPLADPARVGEGEMS